MNKLTAELLKQIKSAAQEEITCREASDTSDNWQDLASPENVLALLEIALPILEQQERCEGEWIEFTGGACPVKGDTRVQVRWSDGSVVTGQASSYGWTGLCFGRIDAYRIIPERATNQNGEQ